MGSLGLDLVPKLLDAIMADEQEPERRKALLALTDVRLSLFLNAPPYSGSAVREPGLAA